MTRLLSAIRSALTFGYAVLPFGLIAGGVYMVEAGVLGGWALVVLGACLWVDDMLPERSQEG